MNWELTFFRTTEGRRGGSCWGHWGIWHRSARRYIVYLVDGPRLTEFDSLQCARLFCEAIDGLTDWSRPHADLFADRKLGRAVHRAALRVTGGQPDLHVV